MRRLLLVSAAIAMAAMVGAAPGSAQAPAQDSVTGTGIIFFVPGEGFFTEVGVDARSGPSGESPSGGVSYLPCGVVILGRSCTVGGGRVTCLNVTGNRAVIGFYGGVFSTLSGPVRVRGLVEIEDNGSPGAGGDTLQIGLDFLPLSGPPGLPLPPDVPITSCPASVPGDGVALSTGVTPPYGSDFSQDYVVTDAKPLPTSKDQCKKGGWQSYGVFKNQGDCVSLVATGGKNPPAGSP
jgi:hypothetical protein